MLSFGRFLDRYTKYKGRSRLNSIRARAKYNAALLRFGIDLQGLPDDVLNTISGFLSDADLRTSRLATRKMNISALRNLRKVIIDIPFHEIEGATRGAGAFSYSNHFDSVEDFASFLRDTGLSEHEISRRIRGGYQEYSNLMLLMDILSSGRWSSLRTVEILPSAKLTDAEAIAIFSALENNRTVSTIYMKDASFDINKVLEVRELSDPPRSFRSITLMPSLTTLDISSSVHGITAESATTVAHCLYSNTPPLRTLACAYIGLDHHTLAPLMNGLQRNLTLTHLDITANPIGDEGAVMIADMLRTNSCLQKLEIRKCRITGGAAAIFDALVENRHLTYLDVSYNWVDSAGDALSALIQQNTPLQSLILQICSLSSATVSNLASSLQHNSTLRELDLQHNGITTEVEHELQQKKSATLTKLLTSTNDLVFLLADD